MEQPKIICQSYGMPMQDKDFGTNANNSKNTEYCHFCFKDGKFTDEGITMQQKIDKNIEIAKRMGCQRTKQEKPQTMQSQNLKDGRITNSIQYITLPYSYILFA